jgi:hypothetical protein
MKSLIKCLTPEKDEGGIDIEHLPAGTTWRIPTKYLPSSFHTRPAIRKFFALAKEEWKEMGGDAEFVVLAMGMALRDITSAHFVHADEGQEVDEDMPDWVRNSKWDLDDIHDVMRIWKQRLSDEVNDTEESEVDNGKGKGKAGGNNGKRKRKEPPSGGKPVANAK